MNEDMSYYGVTHAIVLFYSEGIYMSFIKTMPGTILKRGLCPRFFYVRL